MAGLMGSTKWGHQRKAVALVMTGTSIKSSRDARKFLPNCLSSELSEAGPDDDDQRAG